MTGRIKLLQNGVPTQPDANLPEIPYAYDHPTESQTILARMVLRTSSSPTHNVPTSLSATPVAVQWASLLTVLNPRTVTCLLV
jgi:hypothetical protein